MKVAVVSSICGKYDPIKEPLEQTEKCDFYMFLDYEKSRRKTWNFRKISWDYGSDVYNAKYPKLQSYKLFPDYDVIIWVDGSMELKPDYVEFMINSLSQEEDICFIRHWMRDCVYEEIKECSKQKKFKNIKKSLKVQKEACKIRGVKRASGLYGCTSFIYRVTPQTRTLLDDWWSNCLEYNYRDQINLIITLHDLGARPGVIEWEPWMRRFNLLLHNK